MVVDIFLRRGANGMKWLAMVGIASHIKPNWQSDRVHVFFARKLREKSGKRERDEGGRGEGPKVFVDCLKAAEEVHAA